MNALILLAYTAFLIYCIYRFLHTNMLYYRYGGDSARNAGLLKARMAAIHRFRWGVATLVAIVVPVIAKIT